MTAKNLLSTTGALLIALASLVRFAQAADAPAADKNAANPDSIVELFQAIDDHQVDVKFLAKNDHDARILITNNTKQPIHLQMPDAFVGTPALAQFGGGGGGRVGGGGRGTSVGGGGAQQSVGGGGLGGGGGGIGGGGGGGGVFSVPPEETAKIDVAVVCLNHGLRTPNSAAAYKLVPANEFLEDRPAVVELLKAFGNGRLQHNAVQAATWHLANDMTWDELRAQLQGTRRSPRRPPYFTPAEIRAGMAYANEAMRLAQLNADQYAKDRKARAEKAAKAQLESSEKRSTTDPNSNEPTAIKTESDKSATDSKSDQKS